MRNRRFFLLLFSVIIITYSCQGPAGKGGAPLSSDAAASRAGSKPSLEIAPCEADRNAIFTATPRDFNLAESRITWLINDQPVPDATGPQFKPPSLRKGDTVRASAVVAGTAILSSPVEIRNSPPEVTCVKLMPETLKAGDALYAEAAARDADGDDVSISYEWTVNGQPAGSGQRLEAMPKRGDRILVKATPFDGTDYGAPFVMEKTIMNLPPVIDEHTEASFDGKVYTYQVKASDPDGDALTYSLESAAEGMTIDPAAGLLKWIVPPQFKGKQSASVIVSDGHGGISRYNLKITIQ